MVLARLNAELYPAPTGVAEFEEAVAQYGAGKGTLKFPLDQPMPLDLVRKVVQFQITEQAEQTGAQGKKVVFQQADIFALPFDVASFDHVFVCFVLEHLPQPLQALATLKGLLRPGGTITVIEGDHGSTSFHPDSPAAREAIQCQVTLQQQAGGNALIGRQVYPLLVAAGFERVRVSPRTVYVDASRPDLVDGFTRRTFTAMIEGVRDSAVAAGLIRPERFGEGVRALERTAEADGVFCYTFFKGVGEKR